MNGRPAETTQGFASPVSQVTADKWIRVAGYVIDGLPLVLVIFFAWIPILGLILAGLCLVPYWLLRDVTGASLGKLLLGLKVVARDGQPATVAARILRNLPLALGPMCMLIPFLGYVLAGPVAGTVTLVEGIMLLSQGERLGDRLAKTTVVKK